MKRHALALLTIVGIHSQAYACMPEPALYPSVNGRYKIVTWTNGVSFWKDKDCLWHQPLSAVGGTAVVSDDDY